MKSNKRWLSVFWKRLPGKSISDFSSPLALDPTPLVHGNGVLMNSNTKTRNKQAFQVQNYRLEMKQFESLLQVWVVGI